MKKSTTNQSEIKVVDPQKVKDSIVLGKKLSLKKDITKTEVSMKMYEILEGESREVIAEAFVEGAGLTEKGAMTYYYNCRRKFRKKCK